MHFYTLLSLMLVIAGVYCAPAPEVYKAGGKIGFNHGFGAELGGVGTLSRNGLSLDSTVHTRTGGFWAPKVYAGGFVQKGDTVYAGDASLGGSFKNYLNLGGRFAGGIPSDGSTIPIAFNPYWNVENDWAAGPDFSVYTGDDGWRAAQAYGLGPRKAKKSGEEIGSEE